MDSAFTFGKFLPFHKGHEQMIRFAMAHCDNLTVLVCASDQEKLSGEARQKWIAETFKSCPTIEVKIFKYAEKDLPNTSVSSYEVSKKWAQVFTELLPDCSLLITSEPYGDYLSELMNIRHIPFDLPKKEFPVSGTALRKDLFTHWDFLTNAAKHDLAITVFILGTESSGKTTLTQRLAKHFNCTAVEEAARSIIPNSNQVQFDDLPLVASAHADEIRKAIGGDHPLVIVDTDIHITQSYATFLFGKQLVANQNIMELNKGHLYLYLDCEVDYVQDGTRLSLEDRNRLDASHRNVLQENHISFIEIKGDWENRFKQAVWQIEKVIKDYSITDEKILNRILD